MAFLGGSTMARPFRMAVGVILALALLSIVQTSWAQSGGASKGTGSGTGSTSASPIASGTGQGGSSQDLDQFIGDLNDSLGKGRVVTIQDVLPLAHSKGLRYHEALHSMEIIYAILMRFQIENATEKLGMDQFDPAFPIHSPNFDVSIPLSIKGTGANVTIGVGGSAATSLGFLGFIIPSFSITHPQGSAPQLNLNFEVTDFSHFAERMFEQRRLTLLRLASTYSGTLTVSSPGGALPSDPPSPSTTQNSPNTQQPSSAKTVSQQLATDLSGLIDVEAKELLKLHKNLPYIQCRLEQVVDTGNQTYYAAIRNMPTAVTYGIPLGEEFFRLMQNAALLGDESSCDSPFPESDDN